MKYRIVKENDHYYPEVRSWGFYWHPVSYPREGIRSKEMAFDEIEEHKRIFSKENKKKVVWEEEL